MAVENNIPRDEMIDFGAASTETKGKGELVIDTGSSEQNLMGISDD